MLESLSKESCLLILGAVICLLLLLLVLVWS